jgi:hypothetical protein
MVVNPPGTEGQAVTTAEDTSKSITLSAVSPIPSASFSFTIVTPPAHGQLTAREPIARINRIRISTAATASRSRPMTERTTQTRRPSASQSPM